MGTIWCYKCLIEIFYIDDMYSGGLREGNETGMDICNDNYPDYNINTGSRLVASLKLSQDKHAKKTFQNHGRDRG